MRRAGKIVLKIMAELLAGLLLVVICYVGYVLLNYYRIEDHKPLAAENQQQTLLPGDEEYTITTYNIGFGAYNPEFSFFMDGGQYSRARSKDVVLQDVSGAAGVIGELSPDFALFQEIDTDADRSWHVDQYAMLKEAFSEWAAVFALNYDSPYLFYPFTQPHGKSKAGIATFSKFQVESGLRRSLPIETGFSKFLDLDRCYSVTRIPLEDGGALCLYNAHLSAYVGSGDTRKKQVEMLAADMQRDYQAGNYVICGGDFNQDIYGNSAHLLNNTDVIMDWAQPFPEELLPEGFSVCKISDGQQLTPTCRNADKPYKPGENFVVVLDGFIVSPNVTCKELTHIDTGFAYSDHEPVLMRFTLNAEK